MSSSGSSPVQVSSNSLITVSSMSNVSQASTSMSNAPSVALNSSSPGHATPTVLSSSPSVSSAVIGSFPPVVIRPVVPVAPHPSSVAVQPQPYPSYATIPAVGSSPQQLWLPPHQMGGFRPSLLPYNSSFAGPFGFVARGVSLPSVPVPDAQPPGFTPIGKAGAVTQMAHSSAMKYEVPPPGIGLSPSF